MQTIIARNTLSAIGVILSSAGDHVLSADEKSELVRLCFVLEEGIPARHIYNYSARAFSQNVKASGLIEEGGSTELDRLLEQAESIKVVLG